MSMLTVKTTKTFDAKLEDVISVYSGKANKCCCGCAGTYRYADAHQDLGGKQRGYPVSSDEINDAQVRRIFNLMMAAANGTLGEKIELEAPGADMVSFEHGGRLYTLTFKQ